MPNFLCRGASVPASITRLERKKESAKTKEMCGRSLLVENVIAIDLTAIMIEGRRQLVHFPFIVAGTIDMSLRHLSLNWVITHFVATTVKKVKKGL